MNDTLPEFIKAVFFIFVGILISYPITRAWSAFSDWRTRRRHRKQVEAEYRRAQQAQQEYAHKINLEDYV